MKATIEIRDKDIATIEAMHDTLLDMHKYDLRCRMLTEARLLTERMYDAIFDKKIEDELNY